MAIRTLKVGDLVNVYYDNYQGVVQKIDDPTDPINGRTASDIHYTVWVRPLCKNHKLIKNGKLKGYLMSDLLANSQGVWYHFNPLEADFYDKEIEKLREEIALVEATKKAIFP